MIKLTNLKIGTQLKIGFGIIILLIVVLGSISLYQSSQIAQQTTYLYNHPLQVRRALGELKADILSMHRDMKDLALAENEQEITTLQQEIETYEANAFKQFEVLYNQYLGPRTDVDNAYNDFVKWNTIRDETILLIRNGKTQEAIARTKRNGAGGSHVDMILAHLQIIDDFARSKGDQFYNSAVELENLLNRQMGFLLAGILALSFVIVTVLHRNIRRPISELSRATRLFKEGELNARSSYASLNEFGDLSDSFNDLANTIETEMTLNSQAAKLAGVMLSEADAQQFCHALLKSLLEHTGSQMGAVYLLNDEKISFERFECLGMDADGCKPFSALHFEGEFGVALATQQIQHITQIPEDTRFGFSTVSGRFTPREIITIPIVSGNETVAVISLATIKSFSKNSMRLLQTILNTLSARMDGILTYRKVVQFSSQLEEQNSELEAQRKELHKASSYNRSLLEASIDSLVTIGADGRIMDVNSATEMFTGCSRNELIGTDVTSYFTEPERARAGYQQVFRDGIVRDYELAIRSNDGLVTPVLYNASVYRDETGQVIGVFAAARDISERKKAEEELRILNKELVRGSETLVTANNELEAQKRELSAQASELIEQNVELEMQKKQLDESNRLKTVFLSNMSHELRTPLNSVIALSGVLNRRLAGKVPEEEYSYLDVIERNGKQLLLLINDILDLSRIEAGREDIQFNRFNARELISEVVELITPQASQKSIVLGYSNGTDLPPIKSDYVKCRHILQNLVANAVKFTEVGGVEITAEELPESIQITVSDTGIGIGEEYLPYIFDEFRQADGSNSRKYGGTGLGLAIAKKYAEMLGGSIRVESVRGKGSKFMLNLPLQFSASQANVERYADQQKSVPVSFTAEMNTKDKTILLVEDTEAVIVQMKDILVQQGYNILVARNGSEALEQIEHQVPDAMILDLMMPGVDGFEVLKRIREKEKTDRLPVLILTAKYITKEEFAFLKHNSIYQVVQKGDINKDQLLNAVARMIFPEALEVDTPPTKPMRVKVTGTPRILVVEDNPDNMITIKALLDGKCEIIEAEDGRTGVEQAKKHQPHLILMDIALPGMNGIEAMNEIRGLEALEWIPIVAVSASAMKGDREDFIALGFDGYISKPIDNTFFLKTIAEYLG
jgi:PAS domain S-box-containing protein